MGKKTLKNEIAKLKAEQKADKAVYEASLARLRSDKPKRKAPTDLELKSPDAPDIPDIKEGLAAPMTPEEIAATTSGAEDIQQLEEAPDMAEAATVESVDVPDSVTAPVAQAQAPRDVTAAVMEAAIIPPVKASVNEATGEEFNVAASPEEAKAQQEALTDGPPQGEAVKILEKVNYAKNQEKTVKDAKGQFAKENGVSKDVADQVVADPEQAIKDIDKADIESRVTIAKLPQEALVTTQLDNLLEEMEEGKVPIWARPAVEKVNAMMASRGLSASTVGRDSLFNAIIQSAMPLAQSNATALQARAQQSLAIASEFALKEADFEQQMKLANLSNQQQAYMQKKDQQHRTLLSNQASENAARQFNATSKQQADQFMATMENNVNQFNASADNTMKTLNITEQNKINAMNAGNQIQAAQFNAQAQNAREQFVQANALQRQQWNVANAQAIEQSNVQWRRQTNTAATAAENAANLQNVQNAYGFGMQENAFMGQQLRDEAAYIRSSYENEEGRIAQLYATVIGNDSAGKAKAGNTVQALTAMVDDIFGSKK